MSDRDYSEIVWEIEHVIMQITTMTGRPESIVREKIAEHLSTSPFPISAALAVFEQRVRAGEVEWGVEG